MDASGFYIISACLVENPLSREDSIANCLSLGMALFRTDNAIAKDALFTWANSLYGNIFSLLNMSC